MANNGSDKNGRVAIVTGAGSGIGRAAAVALGERGFAVVLSGRRRGPLEEAAEAVDAETLVLPADVGTEEGAVSIVEGAREAFGRIDAIVNNAAAAPFKPFAEFGWAELEAMYRVNAIGPMAVIAAAWGLMAERHAREGCVTRVVNVSSMATVDPFPGLGAYAASKAALNLLTKACATEGTSSGIKAFAVAPGAVETAMLRSIADEEMLPREKTLTPEAVAEVIATCAAGERDEENGGVIYVPSPE